jgi:hypothetical protein
VSTQRGTEHSTKCRRRASVEPRRRRARRHFDRAGRARIDRDQADFELIRLDRHSIDKAGNPVIVNTHGRHDPCVGIRATPMAEAMLALVLIDHALRHRAQCGDVQVSRFAGSWGRKRDSVTAFRCDLLIKHERFCSLEWVLTRLRGHIARCAQGVEDAQSTAALSRGVPEADGLARLSWAWIS